MFIIAEGAFHIKDQRKQGEATEVKPKECRGDQRCAESTLGHQDFVLSRPK